MNKRIDLSNLGGFPMTQFTLAEMQDSYRGALAAIARLVGSKTILHGVVVAGGTVSDGWIAYNGELIPFIGGTVNTKVAITEMPVSRTFEDTTTRDVYFTKTAACAALGDFNFSELVTLLPFSNIWLPGDLKQKYVDNAYIAANFDGSGFGVNAEKGWRILSSVVPAAAGKVLVNRDAGDVDFDTCGDTGGAKTHTLQGTETGSLKIKAKFNDADGGAVTEFSNITINGQAIPKDGAGNDTTFSSEITVRLNNDAAAHNNLQPFFTVLTLIKL